MSTHDTLERRYHSLQKIGEGGMGEVWRGTDRMLERDVAIKLLRPELASRQDFIERFRNEAISLARLNHPNIVGVYEFAQMDSASWMALEYVQGQTLDTLLAAKGRLDWTQASELIKQALLGLERAHAAGIVHRDVKPSNAIVTPEGVVKLMDFGIARISESVRLTRAGHAVGTLEYMAPEQAKGLETDARADIYSIGIMLFELVCGRVPFTGDTDYEIIKQQIEAPVPSLDQLVPGLPPGLQAIVARALAKEPQKRFASAGEFRQALDQLPLLYKAKSAPSPKPARGGSPGRGMVWSAGLAAAIVVGGLVVAWAVMRGREPAAPAADLAVKAAPVASQPPTDTPAVPATAAKTAPQQSPSAEPATPPIANDDTASLTSAIANCNELMAKAQDALKQRKLDQATAFAQQAKSAFSSCDGADDLIVEARRVAQASMARPANLQRPSRNASVPPATDTPVAAQPAAGPTAARNTCVAFVAAGQDELSNSNYSSARRSAERALAADPDCPGARNLIDRAAKERSKATAAVEIK